MLREISQSLRDLYSMVTYMMNDMEWSKPQRQKAEGSGQGRRETGLVFRYRALVSEDEKNMGVNIQ